MRNTTAFILLLIALGLIYTFILPYYDKVSALRAQSAQYEEILRNVEELKGKRENLQVKFENLPQAEVARLEKVLPSNSDVVSLAHSFDTIAARYGISIKQIQSGSTVASEIIEERSGRLYKPITVSFSFISTYANFRNFLRDIESSLRIIDVKSVSFDSTENGLYDFKLTVDTYWFEGIEVYPGVNTQ